MTLCLGEHDSTLDNIRRRTIQTDLHPNEIVYSKHIMEGIGTFTPTDQLNCEILESKSRLTHAPKPSRKSYLTTYKKSLVKQKNKGLKKAALR